MCLYLGEEMLSALLITVDSSWCSANPSVSFEEQRFTEDISLQYLTRRSTAHTTVRFKRVQQCDATLSSWSGFSVQCTAKLRGCSTWGNVRWAITYFLAQRLPRNYNWIYPNVDQSLIKTPLFSITFTYNYYISFHVIVINLLK